MWNGERLLDNYMMNFWNGDVKMRSKIQRLEKLLKMFRKSKIFVSSLIKYSPLFIVIQNKMKLIYVLTPAEL